MPHLGMDQYLLIPFLGEWPSIYQLFWCELQGYKVLTHCRISVRMHENAIDEQCAMKCLLFSKWNDQTSEYPRIENMSNWNLNYWIMTYMTMLRWDCQTILKYIYKQTRCNHAHEIMWSRVTLDSKQKPEQKLVQCGSWSHFSDGQ